MHVSFFNRKYMPSRRHPVGTALLKATLVLGLICCSGFTVAQQPTPTLEEMWQIIQQQQAEIDALKEKNADLQKQVNAQTSASPLAATKASTAAADSTRPAPASAPATDVVAAEARTGPSQSAGSATELEIYGAAMLDMGFADKSGDPDWYDVLRPTKLPAYAGEYSDNGEFWAGVKQSRLGFKSSTPTRFGDLKTIFEFDLFGVGDNAGQTTFHLRKAWGELGQFGAGQIESVFIDADVFPNSIEFWGPNGIAFFRNVQLRWTPWEQGGSNFAMALERPGASADEGRYSGRIELEGVRGNFPLPDFTAHYKHAQDWGHVQLAGIVRRIEWDDLQDDEYDLSGGVTGWGLNLSTNVNLGPHVFRGSVVYGKGMENYMNDAPVDVGIKNNFSNPVSPIKGTALPVLGLSAFLDLNWNEEWTSTIGYSYLEIDNSDGQADDAFRMGQYALANILYHPLPNLFFGPEIQWGKRSNYLDGYSPDILRLQFSVRWSFDKAFGGF